MREMLATFCLTLGLVSLAAAPAAGAPHHEQQDGCDHGNSNKPCRPDPQPDHGKECEEHGRHGGVNEDHCLNTTTTTTSPTTTTTTSPTPDSPVPVPPTVTSTTSGSNSGASSSTTTTSTPPFPGMWRTPPGSAPSTPGQPVVEAPQNFAELPAELPATGVRAGTLAWFGIGMIFAGLAIHLALRLLP